MFLSLKVVLIDSLGAIPIQVHYIYNPFHVNEILSLAKYEVSISLKLLIGLFTYLFKYYLLNHHYVSVTLLSELVNKSF